jgi:asparagine synthase (glutamine-hydrolysing)
MCGIFYYTSNEILENKEIEKINKNFEMLKHRGPDNTSFFIFKNNFFGVHRLKVINIGDSGNQPLKLDNYILICNGQIYNYIELAKKYNINIEQLRTDVDIILHMIILNIPFQEICQQLDGDFAFVLYNKLTNNLLIARDEIGIRPLFVLQKILNDRIIIMAVSSEIKSLIELKNENIEYKIERFLPNYYYDKNNNIFEKYNKNETISNDNYLIAKNKIKTILWDAVAKRIDNSDRPVAFLCSGGIDSSLILCIANEILKKSNIKIHAFSIQYDNMSYDSFYAKSLTDILGIEHTIINFKWDDVIENLENIIKQIETYDPNTIRASIPMYLMSKWLSKNTDYKIFLSGEGADELFLGYNYLKDVPNNIEANIESIRLLKNLHMFDVLRADRCFNAHGLEIRVPFLDKKVIEYCMKLNGELKMFKKNIEKALLRDSFRQTFPELEKTKIIDRQKERFSDGCGFSYVPQLLKYFSTLEHGDKTVTLKIMKESEKTYYNNIFKKYYTNEEHLIIKRELPIWCSNKNENKKLLDI